MSEKALPAGQCLLKGLASVWGVSELFQQGGQDLIHISHNAVVGMFEDLGPGILVDGDDQSAPGDAAGILGGTGDAGVDEDLGPYGLAAGADHTGFVPDPSRVDEGPGPGDGAAKAL